MRICPVCGLEFPWSTREERIEWAKHRAGEPITEEPPQPPPE